MGFLAVSLTHGSETRVSLFQLSDITFETSYLLKDMQVFCLFFNAK